jgi:putative ABC transport system ATP-binding protein
MLLEIRNLTKTFKQGENLINAVNNVSLTVEKGDFISIIGRSGSGKSTLMNLISGLLVPTAGEIILNGENIVRLPDKDISKIRSSSIGYILQGNSLLHNLTVLENVMVSYYLGNDNRDYDTIVNEAKGLLESVGIGKHANNYPSTLSGGELKRAAIVRSIINRPDILIADEPTSDLDVETTRGIMGLFADIARKGTAILMVTHEPDTVGFGNRVYRMEIGKLSLVDNS